MQDRPSPDEHALELFVLPITPSPADPDSGTVDESKESHGLLENRPREGGE